MFCNPEIPGLECRHSKDSGQAKMAEIQRLQSLFDNSEPLLRYVYTYRHGCT